MSSFDVDPFADAAALEGLPSTYASARDGIDAILRDRGLRRSTPEDTSRSLLLGAVATAALEGSVITPEELTDGGGDATARSALQLSGELLGLVPVWKRAPVQAIARIHALAVAHQEPNDHAPGQPVHPEGARRLTELARNLSRPTTAPGLIVAALVHAEISDAGAFASANGVVARAAERLVLVASGVDPASLVVPEAGHAGAPSAYRAALAAYGSGSATGVHQWLLYAAEAFGRATAASPLSR